jgi:hypothetical protein
MRRNRTFLVVVAFVLLAILTGGPAKSTPPMLPFGADINPAGKLRCETPTNLIYYIKAKDDFDSVDIRVRPYGKLIYYGDTAWSILLRAGDSFTYSINVMIPKNDTSGIRIESITKSNGVKLIPSYIFFSSYGDSIKVFRDLPPVGMDEFKNEPGYAITKDNYPGDSVSVERRVNKPAGRDSVSPAPIR